MSCNYVARDFACGILDNISVMEGVICEDCSETTRGRECPVDYECFNIHCPNHHLAEDLVDDIEKLLNSYGIY